MTFMPLDAGLTAAYTHLTDGTAWNREFETVAGGVESHINSIQASITALPNSINGVESSVLSRITGLQSTVTAASGRMPDFVSHITNHFNNLTHNISTFASAQGLVNALAGKAKGCGSLPSFFGSITTTGPAIVSQITGLVNQVQTEITNFTGLASTLQTQIVSTQSEIINQLNAEIAGASGGQLTNLLSLKTNIQTNFNSGIASLRADLTQQVMSAISTERAALVAPLDQQLRAVDLNIFGSSNHLESLVGGINLHSLSLHDMIAAETAQLTGAINQLETLGAASAMRSLMGSNPCVQTLMGFLGTDNFLRGLRI